MVHTTFLLLTMAAVTGPLSPVRTTMLPVPDGIASGLRQESARVVDGRAILPHCLISVRKQVDCPANESGRIVEVLANEGETVQAGQLLIRTDDREPQLQKLAAELQRDAALAEASDDVEVRFATASADVAKAELEQNLEINRKRPGTITLAEIRRLQLAAHRANLQIEQAKLNRKVAQMDANVQQAEVQAALNAIERRRVKSPLDGMVMTPPRQVGEWVNAGDPVIRIAELDRLHVEGFVNAGDLSPNEVSGRKVTVEIELERGRRESFSGVIDHINPLVQGGNQYRVRALVDNRYEGSHWLLRPGVTATMTIWLK